MKKNFFQFFVLTFWIFIINIPISEAQDIFTQEIRFENLTSNTVYVKCIPISMIFNGYKNYDLVAKNRFSSGSSNLQFDYINSVFLQRNLPDTNRIKKTILELPGGDERGFQFDLLDNEENYGTIGFGKYKKQIGNIIPNEFHLFQNYPNPFNPNTVISYQLSVDGIVSLKVYDVLGKEVATLIHERKSAGRYKVTFDASNFSSGIYFYTIETNDFVQTKRMVLIK